MQKKEILVLVTYNTPVNQLKYLNGTLKFEELAKTIENTGETFTLTKKEVKQIADKLIAQGNMFHFPNVELLTCYEARDLLDTIKPTDEELIEAIKKHYNLYLSIKNPSKEMAIAYLRKYDFTANYMGYGRRDSEAFRLLSEEDIISLVKENPARCEGIPEDLLTDRIVYAFLEAMVRGNYPFLMSGFNNISERFRDRTFYLCFLMVNGYNLSLIPKDEREQYISNNLVNRTVLSSSYTSASWFFENLPDSWKEKEDVAIKYILKHPFNFDRLPKSLNTDAFYDALIEESKKEGKFQWVEHWQEPSVEMVEKLLDAGATRFSEKVRTKPAKYFKCDMAKKMCLASDIAIPKEIITQEIAEILAKNGKLSKIPPEMLTEDMIFDSLLKCRYDFNKLDNSLKTESLYARLWDGGFIYDGLSDYPASYHTSEKVMDAISRGMITRVNQIPANLLTTEVVDKLFSTYTAADSSVYHHFCNLPTNLQTQIACDKALSVLKKGSFSWFYTLKKMESKFRYKEDVDYAVEHIEEAILLSDLTKEQIEMSVKVFPNNSLYVKDESTSNETPVPIKEKEEKPIIDWATFECEQMSLFDLLPAM